MRKLFKIKNGNSITRCWWWNGSNAMWRNLLEYCVLTKFLFVLCIKYGVKLHATGGSLAGGPAAWVAQAWSIDHACSVFATVFKWRVCTKSKCACELGSRAIVGQSGNGHWLRGWSRGKWKFWNFDHKTRRCTVKWYDHFLIIALFTSMLDLPS